MGKFVWKTPDIVVNSQDLSDHVESLTINYGAEIIDMTASGDATRSKLAGLKDWSVNVTFKQDYAASSVDATLFDLVGAASFTITMKPTDSAVGATNPSFSGSALLESYTPIDGSVGAGATTTVTFQGTGTLARATS
jgi:predicted secreted protein